MSRPLSVPATVTHRSWPLARESGALIAFVVAVDLCAAGWSTGVVARDGLPGHGLRLCVLLTVLAVGFEEMARRIGRLKFRISSDLKRDMTSVWSVATVIALPAVWAVTANVALFTFLWFRQERPAGEILYRKLCSHSTGLLGVLAAGATINHFAAVWAPLPWQVRGLVEAVAAIVTYAIVNRGLVTAALVILGARKVSVLVGTVDDNLIEFATLCLGALVGAAALAQPLFCLLVLPAMFVMQRGALVRELETAASTDSKTGLLNAVAWEQVADRELTRAEREQQPISVLIIDIDRFKLVNDQYGHLAGDAALRIVGRTLVTSLREYDTAGRFGGEEFVAVLPGADEVSAVVIAERVRSRINEVYAADFVDGPAVDAGHRLSVSVGVACVPGHGRELPELLHGADRALYRAKSSGRNQVQVADTDGLLPETTLTT